MDETGTHCMRGYKTARQTIHPSFHSFITQSVSLWNRRTGAAAAGETKLQFRQGPRVTGTHNGDLFGGCWLLLKWCGGGGGHVQIGCLRGHDVGGCHSVVVTIVRDVWLLLSLSSFHLLYNMHSLLHQQPRSSSFGSVHRPTYRLSVPNGQAEYVARTRSSDVFVSRPSPGGIQHVLYYQKAKKRDCFQLQDSVFL